MNHYPTESSSSKLIKGKNFMRKRACRKKYIGVAIGNILGQSCLIYTVFPLLYENYLSAYWSDGVAYLITTIIYFYACVIFSLSLLLLQFYFLTIWRARLSDIGFNNFGRNLPFFCFFILLINNFFIFSHEVLYTYYSLIFISALPPTHYIRQWA